MRLNKSWLGVVAAILGASGVAQATVIDFNGTVATDSGFVLLSVGETYSEDGYTMTVTATDVFFIDDDYSVDLLPFDDDVLEFDNNGAEVVFTRDGGLAFNADSVIIGAMISSGDLLFTATQVGGGTVTQSFAAIQGAHTLALLTGFTDLLSLTITDTSGGTLPLPVLDNLTLNERVPVPMPAALMGIGLLCLAYRRRIRNA